MFNNKKLNLLFNFWFYSFCIYVALLTEQERVVLSGDLLKKLLLGGLPILYMTGCFFILLGNYLKKNDYKKLVILLLTNFFGTTVLFAKYLDERSRKLAN